jgi:hypothetical protein
MLTNEVLDRHQARVNVMLRERWPTLQIHTEELAALIATARQHAAIVAEAQRLIRMTKDLAGDKYGGDGPNHYGLAKEVHDGLAECLRMIEPLTQE